MNFCNSQYTIICLREHKHACICEEPVSQGTLENGADSALASQGSHDVILERPLKRICVAAEGSRGAVAGHAAADAAAGQEQPQARHQAVSIKGVPLLQMPLLAAAADAAAAAAEDVKNEEPRHLQAWRRCHAVKSKRAYLTAVFADGKRHLVVEVSQNQTAQYLQAVNHLWEQAKSKNYTKQATVACRDRLLKEGRWTPGVPFRPAARSDAPPESPSESPSEYGDLD
jgi:hypothetical protein